MKELKLVVCDIDSTLIVKHEKLTPTAKKIIDELREKGILFGVASGRSIEELKRTVKRWGFDDLDLIIAMNGSILWDGIHKKEYNYYVLKKEWIKEIIELMSKFPSNPILYRKNDMLCKEVDDIARQSAKCAEMQLVIADEAEMCKEDNAKIMFRVKEEDMETIEKYISKHNSPYYTAFKTQANLLEFADKHTSKAYALKKYCEMHGIELEDVMACGDTSNDNDMIEVSGIGVCMLNGSDDTKALADIITEKTCDDDGWADFMRKWIEKNMK